MMKNSKYYHRVYHDVSFSKRATILPKPSSVTIYRPLLISLALFQVARVDSQLVEPVKGHCKNADTKLDQCSQKLLMFSGDPQYPQSLSQIDRSYCPQFKQVNNCIAKYKDCYKLFDKQIINWVLTSTKKLNYRRCQNEEEKAKFLKLSNSCLTNMKSTMGDCMDRYIASLDAIADIKVMRGSNKDNQIQLSCCANRRFKECSLRQAERYCRPKKSFRGPRKIVYTSARNGRLLQQRTHSGDLAMIKLLEDNLDSMHLTGPEFFCSGIDDNYCATNYDRQYSNYTWPLHKSILPAMLKIYRN